LEVEANNSEEDRVVGWGEISFTKAQKNKIKKESIVVLRSYLLHKPL
jgi:hypothetical protein